jgi:uncharacterized protein (TIGR02996 family)
MATHTLTQTDAMHDDDFLYEAVFANPDDDAIRLQAADWYDDHDMPVRAEAIRFKVKLANCKPTIEEVQRLRDLCHQCCGSNYPGWALFERVFLSDETNLATVARHLQRRAGAILGY